MRASVKNKFQRSVKALRILSIFYVLLVVSLLTWAGELPAGVSTNGETSSNEAKAQPSVGKDIHNEGQISGTPRLIRSQPETEVFFRDLNQSYIIPKDNRHNKIFEAVSKAIKTKSKVTLEVDPKSRRILGLPEDGASSKTETVPAVLEKSP